MFTLEEEKFLTFPYKGKQCNVRFPADAEMSKYGKEVNKHLKKNPEKIYDINIDFLISLGLDKDVANQLQRHQIDQLFTEISGSKKK